MLTFVRKQIWLPDEYVQVQKQGRIEMHSKCFESNFLRAQLGAAAGQICTYRLFYVGHVSFIQIFCHMVNQYTMWPDHVTENLNKTDTAYKLS